jgi:hypothetical protein
MIHMDAIHKLIEANDKQGRQTECSFVYVSKSTGERIVCPKAYITSSNFERRTINVFLDTSKEKRTLRYTLLVEFNGQEVTV